MDKKKLIIFSTILITTIFLNGCASYGNLCSALPIIVDPNANTRLTRSEKNQIIIVNKSSENICKRG